MATLPLLSRPSSSAVTVYVEVGDAAEFGVAQRVEPCLRRGADSTLGVYSGGRDLECET